MDEELHDNDIVNVSDLKKFEGLHSIVSLVNKKFLSDSDAETFYKEDATIYGFSIRRNDNRRDKNNNIIMRSWVCHKEGYRRDKHMERDDRIREPRSITRTGCLACFRIKYDKEDNCWQVTKVVAEHNHQLVEEKHACFLRTNREVSEEDDAQIKSMLSCAFRPCQIMEYLVQQAGGFDKVGFTKKDLYTYINKQKEIDIANGDANAAIGYLSAIKDSDPDFFHEYDLKEGRLSRLFWSDSRSQIDFACFVM